MSLRPQSYMLSLSAIKSEITGQEFTKVFIRSFLWQESGFQQQTTCNISKPSRTQQQQKAKNHTTLNTYTHTGTCIMQRCNTKILLTMSRYSYNSSRPRITPHWTYTHIHTTGTCIMQRCNTKILLTMSWYNYNSSRPRITPHWTHTHIPVHV